MVGEAGFARQRPVKPEHPAPAIRRTIEMLGQCAPLLCGQREPIKIVTVWRGCA